MSSRTQFGCICVLNSVLFLGFIGLLQAQTETISTFAGNGTASAYSVAKEQGVTRRRLTLLSTPLISPRKMRISGTTWLELKIGF
jgi:hypothetical protein